MAWHKIWWKNTCVILFLELIKWSIEIDICILKMLFYVPLCLTGIFFYASKVFQNHVQIFKDYFILRKKSVKSVNIIK
jgi:hypothetical protein